MKIGDEMKIFDEVLSLIDKHCGMLQENIAKVLHSFEFPPKIDKIELKFGEILLKKEYGGPVPLDRPVVGW